MSSTISSSSEDNEIEGPDTTGISRIIGINSDSYDPDQHNYQYFVKYNQRPYKDCKWLFEADLVNDYKKALTSFQNKIIKNGLRKVSGFDELYIPSTDDFSDAYLIPTRLIATENTGGKTKYLIQWGKLPLKDATWEDDASRELIKKHKLTLTLRVPVTNAKPTRDFKKSLPKELRFKDGNVLKDYQRVGLEWMYQKWEKNENCILADEMGMGKTIQALAFLQVLKQFRGLNGPFLIIAPLSTIYNWSNEIEKWTNLIYVQMSGSEESRNLIKKYLLYSNSSKKYLKTEAIIVSYDTLAKEHPFFMSVNWALVVIDEAHRLKNSKSKTYDLVCKLTMKNVLLLTGTPIQNTLSEVFSLLHIIDPVKFEDIDSIQTQFDEEDATSMIELRKILGEHVLHRKKSDYEKNLKPKEEIIIDVEITGIQRTLYKLALDDHRDELLGTITGSLATFKNIAMDLRKICNHPLLMSPMYEFIKDIYRSKHGITNDELNNDETCQMIVEASGKMVLIDKLLPKLKSDGHKVLIFSQMTSMLDIIADYLDLKGWPFERLDGSTSLENRELSIERFSSNEEAFIFLLSTRAGGQGINLTAADTVIIYDSDWNPQNDVQAMARAHRIGQTRDVVVYRLLTRATYEEEMFERASKKLGLDNALMDSKVGTEPENAKELEIMLRKGAYYILKDIGEEEEQKFCSENIDEILKNRSHALATKDGEDRLMKITFQNTTADSQGGGNEWKKDGENFIDFTAQKFWDQFFPKEEPLERTRARRPVQLGNTENEKIMKKKECVQLFRQLAGGGLFHTVAINIKDPNMVYKAGCLMSAIYELINDKKEAPNYDLFIGMLPGKQIPANVTTMRPLDSEGYLNSLTGGKTLEFVLNAYATDAAYRMRSFMSVSLRTRIISFSPPPASPIWWSLKDDYSVIYNVRPGQKVDPLVVCPNGAASLNYILDRYKTLQHECEVLMGNQFVPLFELPVHPSNFDNVCPTALETLRPDQIKLIVRALFLAGLPNTNENLVSESVKIVTSHTSLDVRPGVIEKYVSGILTLCGFRGITVPPSVGEQLSDIPIASIRALKKNIQLLRDLRQIATEVDFQSESASSIIQRVWPLGNWWNIQHSIGLIRNTVKMGFCSLMSLAEEPIFAEFFNKVTAEEIKTWKSFEMSDCQPRLPPNSGNLRIVLRVEPWINFIRDVVEQFRAASALEAAGDAVLILKTGIPSATFVPIGYRALRRYNGTTYLVCVTGTGEFWLQWRKILHGHSIRQIYAEFCAQLEIDGMKAPEMDCYEFFGFRSPLLVRLISSQFLRK